MGDPLFSNVAIFSLHCDLKRGSPAFAEDDGIGVDDGFGVGDGVGDDSAWEDDRVLGTMVLGRIMVQARIKVLGGNDSVWVILFG